MQEMSAIPPPPAPPGPAWWLIVPVFIVAGAAAAWGVRLVWLGRRKADDDRHGMSRTTRVVVGMSLIVGAYHVASWVAPAHWLPLRVVPSRWFLLVGALVLAVVGSLLADRSEKR
ncbi:hypothetical protein PHYC_01808 [Phycisphaerales bacterium]|nr:hypothetical protein PHYC_01808 [Phycisphaerales bacterium]